jgi:hypothetical protein
MNHFVGIHAFLYSTEIWATVLLLYMFTLGALHLGREYFEGVPYQVAHSAQFGDAALIGVVLIAATVLQRGSVTLPGWLLSGLFHFTVALSAVCLGVLVSLGTLHARSGHIMDIYHDIVIAPAFVYFAVTLLPVIWLCGNPNEIRATVCLILFWAVLVAYDIKCGRMNQLKWLRNHGIEIPPKLWK